MKITDEQLSGFLDGELDAAQMEQVRNAIASDESLCDRMAALSMVDHVVKQASEKATQGPIPQHIEAMLAPTSSDNVVSLTSRQVEQEKNTSVTASNSRWQYKLATAASIALVGVLGWQQLISNPSQESQQWQQIASVLDNHMSGDRVSMGEVIVWPQLSFVHKNGALCRQFTVSDPSRNDAVIACKQAGIWQQEVVMPVTNGNVNADEYQTASASVALDSKLDDIIYGAPFNREQEKQAIQTNWQQ